MRSLGPVVVGAVTFVMTIVSGMMGRDFGITQIGWAILTLSLLLVAHFLAHKSRLDQIRVGVVQLQTTVHDLRDELGKLQKRPVISLIAGVDSNGVRAHIQVLNSGASDRFTPTCVNMNDVDSLAYDLPWQEVPDRVMQINNGDRGTLAIAEIVDTRGGLGRLIGKIASQDEFNLRIRHRVVDGRPIDGTFEYKFNPKNLQEFQPLILKITITSEDLESPRVEDFELSLSAEEESNYKPTLRLSPV
jgi:hypothetical protein